MGKNLVKRVTSKAILDVLKNGDEPMSAGMIYAALNRNGYGIYKKGNECMSRIYATLIEFEQQGLLTSSRMGIAQTIHYQINLVRNLKVSN